MRLFLTIAMLSFSSITFADVQAQDAKYYLDKQVTVCGKAVQIVSKENYTFINLNKSHPYQDFYFYYLSSTFPAKDMLNKTVCAKGIVKNHNVKYQIIINSLDQFSYGSNKASYSKLNNLKGQS